MRLIDADALIKDIAESVRYVDEWEKESNEKQDVQGMKCAIETRGALLAMISRLKEAPTIEAEPVRHGKLLEGKTFNDQHCSVCGHRFRDDISFILPYDENGVNHMPKRCPECGCYWDGKGSKVNGCWITCDNCANTSCQKRDEKEGADNG